MPETPPQRGQTHTPRALIREALERALRDGGKLGPSGRIRPRNKREVAAAADCSAGTITQLIADASDARSPSAPLLVRLASVGHQSIEEMFDRDTPHLLREREGVRWRLSGTPQGARAVAARTAAALLLDGETRAHIDERIRALYAARREPLLDLTGERLHDLIASGPALGLIEFVHGGNFRSLLNADLAAELTAALARGVPSERPTEVYVARNLAHKDFVLDPLAPVLVGHVAREIVARHVHEQQTVYRYGFAGGTHCAHFVRGIDSTSSPFPRVSGNNELIFVPLTLEPFPDQRLPTSEGVTSELAFRAGALLGAKRVKALSLRAFGFVRGGRVDRLDPMSIASVRQQCNELDVAVFGCGDRQPEGWLERTLIDLSLGSKRVPCTDLALNLLDSDGEPVPLAEGREFAGINLQGLRRLVRPGKLSLLLTSGPFKGLPLVAAIRSGCVGTVVCDERAAAAALDVLGSE